jgi:hypothetical protein
LGRQSVHVEPLVQPLGHPGVELREATVARTELEQARVLRLPAGSLRVDDELAGDVLRHGGTQIFADQGEREIDARRDPCRRPEVAVANPDPIGLEPDEWVLPLDLPGSAPVRRRSPPIEQPGLGEQQRAGANAGRAREPRPRAAQKLDQVGVSTGCVCSVPADDEERVCLIVPRQGLGLERYTGGGAHGARLRSADVQRVRARHESPGDLERRDRTGGVEQLKFGEEDERQAVRHDPNILVPRTGARAGFRSTPQQVGGTIETRRYRFPCSALPLY